MAEEITREHRLAVLQGDPRMLTMLRETVGLRDPDVDDPLHAQLIDALIWVGPGATFGARIVSLRYVFNWELRQAGVEFATAKTEYERKLTREKARWLAEPKMAIGKAEILAENDDQVFNLKLKYLLAEQRERALRKFLDTMDAALDNHRTDRADQRAVDRATASGYTGSA